MSRRIPFTYSYRNLPGLACAIARGKHTGNRGFLQVRDFNRILAKFNFRQ